MNQVSVNSSETQINRNTHKSAVSALKLRRSSLILKGPAQGFFSSFHTMKVVNKSVFNTTWMWVFFPTKALEWNIEQKRETRAEQTAAAAKESAKLVLREAIDPAPVSSDGTLQS